MLTVLIVKKYIYILEKEAKTIPGGKDSFFNKQCWENWVSTYRRFKVDLYTIYKN